MTDNILHLTLTYHCFNKEKEKEQEE